MRPVDDEYTPEPQLSDESVVKLRNAAAFLLNMTALVLFVTAIPVNVWLWTVAL